jgi:hypothetical protein
MVHATAADCGQGCSTTNPSKRCSQPQVDDATDQQPALRLLDWARLTGPKRVRLDLSRRGGFAILTGHCYLQHR